MNQTWFITIVESSAKGSKLTLILQLLFSSKNQADYHKASTRMMTVGPFPGKISDMDYLAFSYEAGDVLCLEKLIITDDTGKSMEIIQVNLLSVDSNFYISLFKGLANMD